MKIGFIGKGNVAQALAGALSAEHVVRFGARMPEAANEGAIAGVAAWAEAVILTTPWSAEAEVAAALAEEVKGKLVIDATNPLAMTADGPDIAAMDGRSAVEALQARLPGAHVVKTFNQIGAEFMRDPGALAAKPLMFAAGDDEAAKHAALALVASAGFEGVDAGPLANGRHLESLAMLWIWQAVKGPLGRAFGFALSHKSDEGVLRKA